VVQTDRKNRGARAINGEVFQRTGVPLRAIAAQNDAARSPAASAVSCSTLLGLRQDRPAAPVSGDQGKVKVDSRVMVINGRTVTVQQQRAQFSV
jgi:hypothetical protein